MRCYVVKNRTICLILNHVLNNGQDYIYSNGNYSLKDSKAVCEVGQIILNQNVRSYNHRYDLNEEHTFKFRRNMKKIDHVVALAAISCIEYQSCETDNWFQTEAFYILQELRAMICSKLDGCNDVSWGQF